MTSIDVEHRDDFRQQTGARLSCSPSSVRPRKIDLDESTPSNPRSTMLRIAAFLMTVVAVLVLVSAPGECQETKRKPISGKVVEINKVCDGKIESVASSRCSARTSTRASW